GRLLQGRSRDAPCPERVRSQGNSFYRLALRSCFFSTPLSSAVLLPASRGLQADRSYRFVDRKNSLPLVKQASPCRTRFETETGPVNHHTPVRIVCTSCPVFGG